MFEIILNTFTSSFFWSTLIIGFFVIKGGFQKKYIFTDNPLLAIATTIVIVLLGTRFTLSSSLQFFIIAPAVTFIFFVILLLYHFYRNPKRLVVKDVNKILSPADGRIIYIKELDENTFPVSVKKKNLIRLDEITKTDMLKTPCYLVGIAMTLFDVHYNRTPVEGTIRLIHHTDGPALGLRNPESTFINERNTFVIENENHGLFGVVQIAARGVSRCISMVNEGDEIKQGEMIGKIRFGSQVDIVLPRKFTIKVREGDQVYAGKSVIASM